MMIYSTICKRKIQVQCFAYKAKETRTNLEQANTTDSTGSRRNKVATVVHPNLKKGNFKLIIQKLSEKYLTPFTILTPQAMTNLLPT